MVLNDQEKINASHFGEFKKLADALAHDHYEYWTHNKIIREPQVVRMADVSLAADLLIAMCDGLQSKKQIRAYYAQYEKEFPFDPDELARRFQETLIAISVIYPEGLQNSEFRRIHLYYSLFTAIYHLLFGLPGCDYPRFHLKKVNPERVRNRLDHVESVFSKESSELNKRDAEFLSDSRRATTDATVRERRTDYLLNLISEA